MYYHYGKWIPTSEVVLFSEVTNVLSLALWEVESFVLFSEGLTSTVGSLIVL